MFRTHLLFFLAAFCLAASSWGNASEEPLLLLHNGGRVAGILPQAGGRVVLFRTETGTNVLDARPELWKDGPTTDLSPAAWKQYYGESVWAGPQADWWTPREPYPPKTIEERCWPGGWPPDPAWEMAPYAILAPRTAARVVLQSPVSKLTGLRLTKTIELLADGRLTFSVSAKNEGDRIVVRDLWVVLRVPTTARCFFPLENAETDPGFEKAVSWQTRAGLSVMEALPEAVCPPAFIAKVRGTAKAGWMAAATPESFFIVRFPPVAPARIAKGQAPVEACYSRYYHLPFLFEIESHGALTTLRPGEAMSYEETWEIVPNPGRLDATTQSRFLNERMTLRH